MATAELRRAPSATPRPTWRSKRPYAAYLREDAQMRAVWCGSIGEAGAEAIERRTGCSPADAFRVAAVRTAGGAALIAAWLDARTLSWRALLRITVCDYPFSPSAQHAAALKTSPAYARAAKLARDTSAKGSP